MPTGRGKITTLYWPVRARRPRCLHPTQVKHTPAVTRGHMILGHMLGVRRGHQQKLLTGYTLAYICPTPVHVCVPPLGPLRSSPSPTAVKPVPTPPRQNNAAAARRTTSVTRNGVDAEVLALSQQVALPYVHVQGSLGFTGTMQISQPRVRSWRSAPALVSMSPTAVNPPT